MTAERGTVRTEWRAVPPWPTRARVAASRQEARAAMKPPPRSHVLAVPRAAAGASTPPRPVPRSAAGARTPPRPVTGPQAAPPLLCLLAEKLALGHWRVACRRYLMLQARQYDVPAELRERCDGLLQRCSARELARMRADVAAWAAIGRAGEPPRA